MRTRRHTWVFLILLSLFACSRPQPANRLSQQVPLPVPQIKRISQEQYGIQIGSHQVLQDSFPDNQLLVDVLRSHGVAGNLIDTIDQRSASEFDVRNMQAGQPYTILKNSESKEVDFFIYEETEENYVVIDLREGVKISRGSQPVQTEIRKLYLPISTTLFDAVEANQADVSLVKALEQIFAWQVDFFQLDEGDYCQVMFEERFVDGNFIGIGQVLASRFHHAGKDFYAFVSLHDSLPQYYDSEGIHIRRAFLATPVPGTTSDSVVSASTFLQGPKEYLFFAEEGSPVIAVGEGEIQSVTQQGDGITLLLRHNDMYASRYLYLSALEPGIGEGVTIIQGDTLGVVGKRVGDQRLPGVGLRYQSQGETIWKPDILDDSEEIVLDRSEDDAFMTEVRNWKRMLSKIYPPSA